MSEFKDLFNHWKALNGWNTEELCKVLNVQPSQLSAWSTGKAEPSWASIKNFARKTATDLVVLVILLEMGKRGELNYDGSDIQLLNSADEERQQVLAFNAPEQGVSGESIEEAGTDRSGEDRGQGLLVTLGQDNNERAPAEDNSSLYREG